MAASLLVSSPSLNSFRIKQACLHLHSDTRCFSVNVIPSKSMYSHCVSITYASASSLGPNVSCHKNHVSSSVPPPNDFQRSKPWDGMSDLERQLQELFNQVKTMVKMGDKDDAIALLQANYEAVREQMTTGAKGVEQAAILDIIALGYMATGDFKIVGSLLDMMNEVVDNLKDDQPLLDSILTHMGSMYSTVGKFERSMLMYHRAVHILESVYGKNSTSLVTPLLGMAKVLGSIGRTTKAVDTYHRAITILESSRGPESEDVVVPLSSLGNLLIKEGRATDAESPFIRIVQIYKKLYGDSDGRVGIAMCSLAHAKCVKGNADEAIDLYKNGLQVIRNSNYVAVDDSIMEKLRIDLAGLLQVVGRGKEGRELLEECLLVTEKYKGKEHPSSVTHLVNLATSYFLSKNFVEAECLLRTSLDIMMKTVGHDDPSVTFPMLHLAITLYHLNRDEEAEQLALEVLSIRQKAFGKDSLPVGEVLDCLVSIQTRLGKDDGELLELLKRILRIEEKEFGLDSEEIMVTLKKIVYYLEKLGRKDEKSPLQRRLSVLRMKYKQTVQH
ncbi:TPR_10 domain-containing protein/TPR_12 domain-containing protein [Cephalotus follicularis]|uniref:TPR_10 domain-containing protein/TPR_12 domain-containing protein n=1 Tax=Cephalotus follicularis TaxID=3775 RepID=A0A1Q3D9G3_CEPFO|nr:TPR_10 domain-containing protein/TPR_12 domain-containing protein [Cephalotus follicularis]